MSEEQVEPPRVATNEEHLALLNKHFVAIVGDIESVDSKGVPQGDRRPYAISATLVTFEGRWFVLTAGHAVEEFEQQVNDPGKQLTEGALALGFFSKEVPSIRFSILERPQLTKHCRNQGVDYALFFLEKDETGLLRERGLEALPLCDPAPLPDSAFSDVSIYGMPGKWNELPFTDETRSEVEVEPNQFPLHVLPDDTGSPRPWLKGYLKDMGPLKKIKGVSGGPLFAFRMTDTGPELRVVAIQSWWHEGRLYTYACRLAEICNHAADELRNMSRGQ